MHPTWVWCNIVQALGCIMECCIWNMHCIPVFFPSSFTYLVFLLPPCSSYCLGMCQGGAFLHTSSDWYYCWLTKHGRIDRSTSYVNCLWWLSHNLCVMPRGSPGISSHLWPSIGGREMAQPSSSWLFTAVALPPHLFISLSPFSRVRTWFMCDISKDGVPQRAGTVCFMNCSRL